MYTNKIEELVLLYSTQLPACQSLLQNSSFKLFSQQLDLKFVVVDDETTRHMLLRANVTVLPLLLLKIGEDLLEVKTTKNILKVLSDLFQKKANETSKKDLNKVYDSTTQLLPSDSSKQYVTRSTVVNNDDDEEISVDSNQQLFKAQVVYKAETGLGPLIISFMNCDKFMSLDNTFDLTVVNENCRKVHFESENYLSVNVTSITALRKITPVLINKFKQNGKLNILAVSKSKKLADILSAMCMFFIQHNTLDEIQAATNVPKKTLTDLLSLDD